MGDVLAPSALQGQFQCLAFLEGRQGRSRKRQKRREILAEGRLLMGDDGVTARTAADVIEFAAGQLTNRAGLLHHLSPRFQP